MLTYPERAAELHRHMCTHDGAEGHGYSQYTRWGDGTAEVIELSDESTATIANGDYDCSSSIAAAWEAILPGSTGGATYTGNFVECFTSTGLFEWLPGETYGQVGDILLNEAHHVAMQQADGTISQFSISELGTVYGEQGDQTGSESAVMPWYDYPWDGTLHYVGPSPDADEDIVWMQTILNDHLGRLGLAQVAESGSFDDATRHALIALLQVWMHACGDPTMAVSGEWSEHLSKTLDVLPVRRGMACLGAWCVKAALVGQGRGGIDLTDWRISDTDAILVKGWQTECGINATGIASADTIFSMMHK